MRRYGDKIAGIETALGIPSVIDTMNTKIPYTNNDMSIEEIRDIRKKDYREHNEQHKFDQRMFAGYLDDITGDMHDEDMIHSQRLSAAARLNIYKLYLEGKTIGEICTRFGIVPERAKAVVFMQQNYFEAVVPRIDAQTVVAGLELDTMVGTYTGTMDYGLDLEALQGHVGGNIDYGVSFKNKNLPPPRYIDKEKELKEDFKDIVRSRRMTSQDILITAVSGNAGAGYIIKDIYKHKGKGAQSSGKTFYRLLRTADRKDGIPRNAQKQVSRGPRAACNSFPFY